MVILWCCGQTPRQGTRVFVAPTATLVGDVVLDDDERRRVADTAARHVATEESALCGEDGP